MWKLNSAKSRTHPMLLLDSIVQLLFVFAMIYLASNFVDGQWGGKLYAHATHHKTYWSMKRYCYMYPYKVTHIQIRCYCGGGVEIAVVIAQLCLVKTIKTHTNATWHNCKLKPHNDTLYFTLLFFSFVANDGNLNRFEECRVCAVWHSMCVRLP